GRRWPAVRADEPVAMRGEDFRRLYDVGFGASGDRDDLAHPAASVAVPRDVHHEIDAGRNGGDDERGPMRTRATPIGAADAVLVGMTQPAPAEAPITPALPPSSVPAPSGKRRRGQRLVLASEAPDELEP